MEQANNQQASIRIEAKTVDQALVKASGSLGVTQDQIGYEVVSEKGAGLFGFLTGGAKVEIRAWIKPARNESRNDRQDGRRGGRGGRGNGGRRGGNNQDRSGGVQARDDRRPERRERLNTRNNDSFRDGENSDGTPALPKRDLTADELATLKQELIEFCSGICQAMTGDSVTVTADLQEDRLIINIDHEYLAEQITKNSRIAEALEHLLRKKPRHLKQELPFRIFVDVRGSRRARETELVQMAHDLSLKVQENMRPIVLNYKSAYDRKIIHMALDSDDRVYTKSIGSGPNRKLMILPSNGQPSGEPTEYHG